MASILNNAIKISARKSMNSKFIISNTRKIVFTQEILAYKNNNINFNKFLYYSTDQTPKKNENDTPNMNRNSSSDKPPSNERKKRLPTLMQFPEILWPSFFKSIKNWILINFIIKPYFDKEFDIGDFTRGTQQALQVVSNALSDGDFNSLEDIVDQEAIAELKTAVSQMSLPQRSELRVSKEDIYFAFPYQVGIMFDESNEKIQKRFVEITMIFHVFRGLKEIQEKHAGSSLKINASSEYMDSVSICNYRFIKEFTQGVESNWVVNIVNHFKPSDYIRN